MGSVDVMRKDVERGDGKGEERDELKGMRVKMGVKKGGLWGLCDEVVGVGGVMGGEEGGIVEKG